MTDYAAILAGKGDVAERGQMIADMFNANANPHPYIEFKLGYTSQQNAFGRQVFALKKSQVDGTALAFAIAAKNGTATRDDAATLRAEHERLVAGHLQHKAALEKTAADFAPLQERFNVLLAAEQKMKSWSHVNLSNTMDLVQKNTKETATVQEMLRQLPEQESMLEGLGNNLQNMELDIWRRDRRAALGDFLKNGIATGSSVSAPKTARFVRRATKVQL